MKKFISIVCCLSVILLNVSSATAAQNDSRNLSAMSIENLVGKLNQVYSATQDFNEGISEASVLRERLDEIPENRMMEWVCDETFTNNARTVMIQLSDIKQKKNQSKWQSIYEKLLCDKDETQSIRQNALWALEKSDETENLLINIVRTGNGALGFQALKRLSLDNNETAILLSKKILEERKSWDQEKVRAAIKIIGETIKQENIETQKKFIALCDEIESESTDQIMNDTIFFAICDLDSEEAMKSIVTNQKFDKILKDYYIQKNIDKIQCNKEICELIKEGEIEDSEYGIERSSTTSYLGYAIYRDGVVATGSPIWHAGLMNVPKATTGKFLIHITDLKRGVIEDNFSGFLDGNTFQGIYKPKTGLTTAKATDVVLTARKLTTESLGYTPVQQVTYYTVSSTTKTKAGPEKISNIRCDGVVEYCYEYNDIKICGSGDTWDISINNTNNVKAHALASVTPNSQATKFMTKVRPDLEYS